LRILIADDSEIMRNAIKALISREPTWVVCAEAVDGLQALQQTHETSPDVALLDINMPGVNGLETARRLRREAPDLAIFIMSQNDANILLPGCLQAGANGCLDKSDIAASLAPSLRNIENNRRSGVTGTA
jgi:two-component system, NarL family, response regulator DesR